MKPNTLGERFDEKFPPYTGIGAARPMFADGNPNPNHIKSFFNKELLALAEGVEGMKKEQLDKNDPDNYGACYAIAGFNDALTKLQSLIRSRASELISDK